MAADQFSSQPRVALAGSERQPFRTATVPAVAAAASKVPARSARITVSVVVRGREPVGPAAQAGVTNRLTRAAFNRKHGADPASLRLVRAFAAEFGLTVEVARPGPCTLMLSGTQAAMEKAFGLKLALAEAGGVTFRVRQGAIYLPQSLEAHIEAVLGLDNRPQALPHFRVAKPNAVSVSYTPVQVGQLYGFPAGAAVAQGQTIGVIELGGGYRTADVTAYFKALNLPAPAVTAVSVDKGKNTPGTADGADGEVMLDIEVAGAVAAGAKIVVYFAPNTDQGFIDAISTAVHDATNKPSVISISWGGPESSWTAQAMSALDGACQAAATLGVTITVAAGDNGSSDGATGNNVDFPASSPHVLACGGTTLNGSGSTIANETVWNETASNEGATGGGVSSVFALPTWQAKAGVPAASGTSGGRGVPDVAGDADPSTGYSVRVDGQQMVIGGTSAVAPLWAGLIAIANAQNKVSAGFVNAALYSANAVKAFRDITQGNNGAFAAGPGWDACTGLGSPIGAKVIAAVAPGSSSSSGGKGSSTGGKGKKGSKKSSLTK